ncbi:hypothetical protein Sliba_03250 [Streptomyces nigrescens]|uniref:Uncharacterized protein n=1 Tax=Streptomyces nigrescens TaxID=1920 RepID=A0A640TA38_STRNI|nr:hypothetical protein Sliba_03250 [Streptomyces libani subsp. libani]
MRVLVISSALVGTGDSFGWGGRAGRRGRGAVRGARGCPQSPVVRPESRTGLCGHALGVAADRNRGSAPQEPGAPWAVQAGADGAFIVAPGGQGRPAPGAGAQGSVSRSTVADRVPGPWS